MATDACIFKQENSYLKTRLSKVVDGNTGKEFIDLAEHYQNQFVLKDEFIDDLKQDVNKLIQFLKKEEYGNSISFRKLEASQKRLRNEMESLEKVLHC
ncbi:MAG: hypothetical protein IPP48_04315 [Chitinophagaceae bacterium]|nr:hypothetical protein [Chitinophagaceae bacterium]